ncbi:hypothetical protein [Maledivibacter halophilus]|uniref:Drug/metabolite transporter, DME family n=1 Tax=Maledivibacter halophilus TaxID=36842 RepID=A0A1T5MVP6_9FIRM|nr:hypothetical protein [Maledivibacter halophilus]SKC92282.1 drug/metabolite transporter, DME family [Maledivibacter halophilus]
MVAILWGTTGSAQAFAPENATPIVIGALCMTIGGTALFLMTKTRGAFKTGVALGTVLALGSAPIFSGIIEYFMGEKLSRRWIIGTIVSIIGCTLLFGGQDSMNMNVLGSILSLGAVLYLHMDLLIFQHLRLLI